MPASYAHLFFGERAVELLPEKLAKAVNDCRELYNIGLHGPDIFFYYKPYCSNPVSEMGDGMHYLSARSFFEPARDKLNGKGKTAKLSYLCGFLCHYALDSATHSYVERKIEVSGVNHIKIENEFDRYLLSLDGKDISRTDLTSHIVPTELASNVISELFDRITAKQVKASLKGMKLYSGLLNSRALKRTFTHFLLLCSGRYDSLKEYIVPKNEVIACKDSNLRLEKLLYKALENFPKLANEFNEFLEGGEYPESMEKTFAQSENYKDIQILSFEEEINYEA